MIGQTLGHYRIIEKIGEGGMGVVYRAHDERLDRDVALKILPAGMLANLAAVKSFREEAQALSRLNHPNIATIHDFDAQDGLSFLVMEYIQGSTLHKKVAAGPLPEKEVIRLGTQLAQGLQAAHTKGIIHRDLKPSNLAVTADYHLKILDFGLARLSAPSDPDATQTRSEIGLQAGTLPYMAPEQLQGQPADERSDIYAAGAVLYEMSTGQRLFPDKHGTRLMDAINHSPVRPPRDLNNQISRDLQDIIQKAIDKDPDRRYQSAKELKVDLQRLPLVPKAYEPETDQEPIEASLETAHVLYMDIVDYSQFPPDQQKQLTEQLQSTALATPEFSRAKSRRNLISFPAGDGMALAFFNDPESACRCALELSHALRDRPETKLRMGVHTGLVCRTADINGNRNLAGGGVNRAQRVTQCGDAGHILVAKEVADMLAEVSSWNSALLDLGEAEAKPGARIHIFNLCTENAGNPEPPKRLIEKKRTHKSDSGRVARVPSKSRVHSKNGSGVKKAGEITEDAAQGEHRKEQNRQPAPLRPKLLTRLYAVSRKKLRLMALTMLLMLAILGFALFHMTTVAAVLPGVPSLDAGKFLAVLPFVVEGDRATLQPVADGLNDRLSAKLLALRDLTVASARATEEIDPHASLATIGALLGDNLVIRGNIQGDAKTIRVTVTVDEVTSRKRRLNQRFHSTRSELVTLEDQIYARVLQALELNPTGEELARTAPPLTDSPEAYELYYKGRSAYRGYPDVDQVKAAISLYEQAVQEDSNFALARASLAEACLRMYRETKDAAWVQRAMREAALAQKLNPNLKEVYVALGNVYRATGNTDEAIKDFRRALGISPNCDDCYRSLGQAYLEAGNKTQAIISLQNAVTLNPYWWSNQNELALAYLDRGEMNKALAEFLLVVEVEPNNPVIHENLGAVYVSLARYEESIPEFEKAIGLQASNADLYTNLGEALFYLKRYTEALKYLEQSASMKPNDQEIIGNLADGYRWTQQYEKSIETYDRAILLANKALDVNPRDVTALRCLAAYNAKKGEKNLARHYINSARAIDSSDPETLYNEAIVGALAKQPESALASLRIAFERGIPPGRAELEPEFNQLQNNPAFTKLVEEFKKKRKQLN